MFSRRLRCSTRASLAPVRRTSSTTCLTWLASSTATSTRLNTGAVPVVGSLAGAFSLTCILSPDLITAAPYSTARADEPWRSLMPTADCKAPELDHELVDSHAVCQDLASGFEPPRVRGR